MAVPFFGEEGHGASRAGRSGVGLSLGHASHRLLDEQDGDQRCGADDDHAEEEVSLGYSQTPEKQTQ
ncbi:hypothetical protein ACWDWU_02780 [Streptomyces sp. NPDC003442]